MDEKTKALMNRQQYGIAGKHSAAKICTWTKKSLLDKGDCYKGKFYGIRSWMCCQMTPCIVCTNRCVFCWREFTTGTAKKLESEIDEPDKIIDNCVKAHRKLLTGFGGNEKTNMNKFEESKEPMHFAISLTGEPTMYPKISELIKRLHEKGKTTFLVTNGMFPDVLEKIEAPTQLYISVDAPNREEYGKIDNPIFPDYWERFIRSLELMKKTKTRTAIRITLVKGVNDSDINGYAGLVKIASPMFVEVKAYMFVGSSRKRLKKENMPLHEEVVEFSKKLAELIGYKIIDEQKESRVVLLMKEDFEGRMMKF
ncbi:4-demethylwyosine synthase TYW1 [Candidatus Woesearchaeota archaeon]|nr:4-demethylwyosine synthase TYW1 [Candidatus Woesearchaeota archaeon]